MGHCEQFLLPKIFPQFYQKLEIPLRALPRKFKTSLINISPLSPLLQKSSIFAGSKSKPNFEFSFFANRLKNHGGNALKTHLGP